MKELYRQDLPRLGNLFGLNAIVNRFLDLRPDFKAVQYRWLIMLLVSMMTVVGFHSEADKIQ